MKLMTDVVMLIVSIINIPLCIWLGNKYYNWVLRNYDTSSDIGQAGIFGGLFMSIIMSIFVLAISLSNIIGL